MLFLFANRLLILLYYFILLKISNIDLEYLKHIRSLSVEFLFDIFSFFRTMFHQIGKSLHLKICHILLSLYLICTTIASKTSVNSKRYIIIKIGNFLWFIFFSKMLVCVYHSVCKHICSKNMTWTKFICVKFRCNNERQGKS